MDSPLKKALENTIRQAVLLTLIITGLSDARLAGQGNRKVFETWIRLEHSPEKIRGVLYETRDSSILISRSLIRSDYPSLQFQGSELNYSQLGDIRIRRLNSIPRGAVIGGITGFCIVFIGTSLNEEVPLWASFLFSIPAAGTTAAIGALAGAVKIRIPLYGNYQAYSINRDKLNYYSFLENKAYAQHEHENYFAFTVGPSFPLGELRSINADTSSLDVHNGYNSEFALFAKLAPDLALKVFFFDNQYEAGPPTEGYWFVWSGLGIGPVASFPLSRRILLDAEPGICFGNTVLMQDEKEIKSGAGLTIITGLNSRFNLTSRWCLMAGASYSLAKVWTSNNNKITAQAINLRFGAGYRFR
ncbi:MAG: hypothetical protein U0T82_07615 [Bacteroidales bacterium]